MLRIALAVVSALIALAASSNVRAAAATTTLTQTTVNSTGVSTYSEAYTYNTSAPTSSDIAHWGTGWPSASTGWSYVGSDNGASAVYLGNGYVLSAGHVGAGNFILDGNTYTVIGGSAVGIGTSDLSLYKVNTTSTTGNVLTLPALTLETSAPALNDPVVMIGYGSSIKAWATNTIYETGQDVPLSGFDSTDFFTVDNFTQTNRTNVGGVTTTTYHSTDGQLVPGDSGGATFIYDSGVWELAGINEAQLTNSSGVVVGSAMVEMDVYASQINAIINAPEPSTWCSLAAGLLGLGVTLRLRKPALARNRAR